jgi:hypothetical protein
MSLAEIIDRVIALAAALDRAEGGAARGAAPPRGRLPEAEPLRALLHALPPAAIYALMFLACGDDRRPFDVSRHWLALYVRISDQYPRTGEVVEQMVARRDLAAGLARGAAWLARAGYGVDRLLEP